MFEKGLTATTATSAIFPSSKSMASAEKLAPQTVFNTDIDTNFKSIAELKLMLTNLSRLEEKATISNK